MMKKLALLMPLTALMVACGGSAQQAQTQQQALQEYNCMKLDTTSAVTYVDYAAEIKGEVMVDILPRVTGYISQICVAEGSTVKKGDVLFRIDQQDLLQSVNSAKALAEAAKAQAATAELSVKKLTPLVEKGIVSEYELEDAKSSYEAAHANYRAQVSLMRTAQVNLSYATITAPMSGTVGRIEVRAGSLVSPSSVSALTTIAQDTDIAAYFSMDERSMMDLIGSRNIKEAVDSMASVELIMANGRIYDKLGTLELASGQIDQSTGSVQLKANFDNQDNILRSGSAGVIRINDYNNGVILVPQSATYEVLDRRMVYTVSSDSAKIASREITYIGSQGSNFIVTGGLTKGETILLEGLDFVREGTKISPKFASQTK
ncbi:MAG: efflux RND transporter periplasmic adaptor subunit [Rikenellaceae bacterium]